MFSSLGDPGEDDDDDNDDETTTMWMDVVMIVVMTMRAMAGAVAGALEFEPQTTAPDQWFDRGGHGRCKWSVLFEKAAPDRCPRPFMIMIIRLLVFRLCLNSHSPTTMFIVPSICFIA